jgi:guanylate kinase
MIQPGQHPLLLVISAPSGAGKTTLCRRLMDEFDKVRYSVSCTTRPPRPSEIDGTSYHFLSEEEFERRIGEGAFLEYARVYGHYYGTLRETVAAAMHSGFDVLMDLDIQGARNIREQVLASPEDDPLRKGFVDIFIGPPSIAVLEQRLRKRGEDAPDVIERRLREAAEEITCCDEYQYAVVNDELDVSYDALRAIYRAELHRVRL